MERYSYNEIIDGVEENFNASYRLGDTDHQALLRLVDDFYREIIQENPVEALMIYIAIYNYLIKKGKDTGSISKLLNDFSGKFDIDQLAAQLSDSEKEQVTVDIKNTSLFSS